VQEFQYLGDILKEFFAPAIVNQVYKKAPLWAQVQKREKGVYGKSIYIPVQTAFTEAVGARYANNYALPAAGRNVYTHATIYLKRIYGRIAVDGFSIEAAKNKGGWVDIISAETKGVTNAFAIDVDRQSLGQGLGVLALFKSGTSGNSYFDVKDAGGITGDTPAAKFLRVGMVLDTHDVSNSYTRIHDGVTVTGISGDTVTIDSTVGDTIAAGDYITRSRVLVSGSTPAAVSVGEMMGIDRIISSADGLWDFEGIDRATETTWQAYEDDTSQVLSENVIQEALDAIENRTDANAPDLILTTFDLRNKLISLIRTDRQITTMDLKAGWKAIRYIGGNVDLPIMTHKNCPAKYMYFISLPHLYFYTLKNLVWDEKGGGVLKPVAGQDVYEAWFKLYGNLATDCPNSMGKLTGLTTA